MAFSCEMCGSADVVKQEGVFICQSCGTKYSVEEVKKMMGKGTVDVSGSTVRVDNTARLDNLYQLARRAWETDDLKTAKIHYEAILLEDPSSWEATLYATYLSGLELPHDQLEIYANRMIKTVDFILTQIQEKEPITEHDRCVDQVIRLCDHQSVWVCNTATRRYRNLQNQPLDNKTLDQITYEGKEYTNTILSAAYIMYALGDALDEIFTDDADICLDKATAAWKCGNDRLFKFADKLPGKDERIAANNFVVQYLQKIKKYETSYVPPMQIDTGGCYVATCVYGSYDCPQVWTLRRFRDDMLAQCWFGRGFIRVYYAVSPTLVKWFGDTHWFRSLWKAPLDGMVKWLNTRGVEAEPYQDKRW